MASSTPHQTIIAFSSFISRINPGISSLRWGSGTSTTPSDCLPVCIRMQRPQPATSPQNLGKTILGLTFQAVLALFISLPTSTSSPPLATVLFTAAVLISFAFSFAGLFLQNAFLKIAFLFEKIGALFAAIGVCILASLLLVHKNIAWICWLACVFSFIVFALSFR